MSPKESGNAFVGDLLLWQPIFSHAPWKERTKTFKLSIYPPGNLISAAGTKLRSQVTGHTKVVF